jgi:hypothetical protein
MKYCNKHQNTLIKCQESRRKKQTVARAESPASVRARPPTPGHRRRKQSRNLPVGETKKHTMRLSRLYKSKVGEQQRERERAIPLGISVLGSMETRASTTLGYLLRNADWTEQDTDNETPNVQNRD